MKETACPLCQGPLEVREVAPCEECGGDPDEVKHWTEHKFTEYEVFPGLRLVLCNFCDVDFESYHPDFFGLKDRKRMGLRHMSIVRGVTPSALGKDKYCASCGYRLAFLRFVHSARQQHAS